MRRRSGWSLFASGEQAGAHERPHGELSQPDSNGPSHFPTTTERRTGGGIAAGDIVCVWPRECGSVLAGDLRVG